MQYMCRVGMLWTLKCSYRNRKAALNADIHKNFPAVNARRTCLMKLIADRSINRHLRIQNRY